MLKKVTTLAAALSLAALSIPSFAATGAATTAKVTKTSTTTTTTSAAKIEKAIGSIASVDAASQSLVVKTKSKTDTFSVPASAKITSHGKTVPFSDLKAGEKVEVTYTAEGSTMTATVVTLLGHA